MRVRLLLVGLVVLVVMAAVPAGAGAKGAPCRLSGSPPETRVVDSDPPQPMLDWLGVLRRPQTDVDVTPLQNGAPGMRKFLRRSVRFLGESESGSRYYMFLGTIRAFRYPERCIRRMSPGQQRRIRRLQERALKNSKGVRIGLFSFEGRGGGGSFGARLLDVLRRPWVQTHGGESGSEAAGLVPDGVATVEMRFSGAYARTVTVANNWWATEVPLGAPSAFPLVTIWRAADGTILKTFREDVGYKLMPTFRLPAR